MLKQLEAEPVHAGVEMQRARENAAAPHGEGGPAREFLLAADDRREAALGIVRGIGAALEAVEDVDRRFSRQRRRAASPSLKCATKNTRAPAAHSAGAAWLRPIP